MSLEAEAIKVYYSTIEEESERRGNHPDNPSIWQLRDLFDPKSACIDEDGRLWVADRFNKRVIGLDEEGNDVIVSSSEGESQYAAKEGNTVLVGRINKFLESVNLSSGKRKMPKVKGRQACFHDGTGYVVDRREGVNMLYRVKGGRKCNLTRDTKINPFCVASSGESLYIAHSLVSPNNLHRYYDPPYLIVSSIDLSKGNKVREEDITDLCFIGEAWTFDVLDTTAFFAYLGKVQYVNLDSDSSQEDIFLNKSDSTWQVRSIGNVLQITGSDAFRDNQYHCHSTRLKYKGFNPQEIIFKGYAPFSFDHIDSVSVRRVGERILMGLVSESIVGLYELKETNS